jgi:hypothetical protein
VGIPFAQKEIGQGEFGWNNFMFGVLDSSVYYTMIRHYEPSRVVEIGSGFSTLIATRAARKNLVTIVECIEPYPIDFFSSHLVGMKEIELTIDKVQNVDPIKFSSLIANDILFIDSSHVVKAGSDVEHLVFRVLPLLSTGVIVHFHDIYLPYSYPRSNIEPHLRFWNENYLLAAYFANNAEWEILVSNCTLGTVDNLNKLCETVASDDALIAESLLPISPGGSLWVRKK